MVEKLLELDLGAGFFQLLLDFLGVVFAGAFLDGLRSAVDQILGFFQAQAGDLADNLDDVDLVGADFGENHVKLGLLFRSSGSGRSGSGGDGHRGGGGNAEFLFEGLNQLGQLSP